MIFACLSFSSSHLTYQYFHSIYLMFSFDSFKMEIAKKITATFSLQMNGTTDWFVYTCRINHNTLWRWNCSEEILQEPGRWGEETAICTTTAPCWPAPVETIIRTPPTNTTALAPAVLTNKWTSRDKIFLI